MLYVFCLSVSVVVYTYAGYPLLIWLLSLRAHESAPPARKKWPEVTFITPVYNDLEKAKKKIENLLEVDYPHDKVTIVMVSDGSTDGTDECLSQDDRISFIS